jgi:probable selenium-dependent hydroxylase accessory protein YqeC
MEFYPLLFTDPVQALGCRVALFGAGGKTSLLFKLGRELAVHHPRVLLSSLTKAAARKDQPVILSRNLKEPDLAPHFTRRNPLFLMREKIAAQKLAGLDPDELHHFSRQTDVCLFECDGARKCSLKVHTDYDPAVPAWATHVIILVGADVVGTAVAAGKVHRPERFQEHWRIPSTFILDTPFITHVVTSRQGYLAKVPPQAKRIYFVNKADTHPDQARRLARSIRAATGCPTFHGSLQQGFYERG